MSSTDTLKTIIDPLSNEEHLKRIQEFTQTTAANTTFYFWREADFWEYIAISLSVLAILLAIITAVSQWKTEKNTRMSLSIKTQVYESIFKLLLNDLYRIQCDILSLQIILIENNFQSYPSKRYLKNMMIKFDDSSLDSFLVVFNKKYKNKAEEQYLKIQEINRLILDYNINIEILIEHLESPIIDSNTKLFDFSTINNNISFLSKKIIQTAEFIYGKTSDVNLSLLQYIKNTLNFFISNENNVTSKENYKISQKHKDIIVPILNNYFKHTNIIDTEKATLLAYKFISTEIEKNDSKTRKNLIKLNS